MSDRTLGEGVPSPLGSYPDGQGVNFAVFSAHATAVTLCLFDAAGIVETESLLLPGRTGDVWHGRVDGLRAGQVYGFRVDGPHTPEAGHRFDPGTILLDPYARLLSGPFRTRDGRISLTPPRGVVVAPPVPDQDHRPRRSWSETVIYEAHVDGLTRLHPEIPEPIRGTCEAFAHPAVIAHLLRLGVTALELLPIQAIADEPALIARGLVNHWGYSTLSYFAPEPRYLGPAGPEGLRAAIRTLHAAGIEVILDVVLNHSCEGEEDAPTLSFRGIDDASYYKHRPGEPGRYWDVTGCGNTLDLSQPRVRQLAVDSLRHWADAYGVDGFRFDLAPALAREPYGFDPLSPFFEALALDPVLGGLKLIAEPWDVGPDGYRLGQFPTGWASWNDQARDTVRRFWRGDPGQLPRLTQGLAGSKEILAAGGRTPLASINYVASHDGFTLRDATSYERKHNGANGEGNRDGHDDNHAWNHGVEGETQDPAIRAARARTVRAMLATVFLSQGVPMLLAGDELSRTQGGNNNPYCQENATTWLDWEAGRAYDPDLPDFVANLAALRRRFAGLRRSAFLTGRVAESTGLRDVYWLAPSGREMTGEDWADTSRQVLGMQLGNDAPDGARCLVLVNGSPEPVAFALDPDLPGEMWRLVFDSTQPTGLVRDRPLLQRGGTFALAPRSLVFLQHDI